MFLLLSYISIWRKEGRGVGKESECLWYLFKEFLVIDRLDPYSDIDKDSIIIFRSEDFRPGKNFQSEAVWKNSIKCLCVLNFIMLPFFSNLE